MYAIREAAIQNLKKLIDVFGIEWANQAVIPQVLENAKHTNYLYRMTVLYSIVAMAPVVRDRAATTAEACKRLLCSCTHRPFSPLLSQVGPELLTGTLLPMVIQMSADPVPNVRFNAAKTLRQLAPMLDAATVVERVRPCLTTLVDDQDHDVSYFATQGLQGI